MFSATRESYDKEINDLLREKDAINDQAQRLRKVVEDKDRQLIEAVRLAKEILMIKFIFKGIQILLHLQLSIVY